jgi:hypothetical protein
MEQEGHSEKCREVYEDTLGLLDGFILDEKQREEKQEELQRVTDEAYSIDLGVGKKERHKKRSNRQKPNHADAFCQSHRKINLLKCGKIYSTRESKSRENAIYFRTSIILCDGKYSPT